MNVNIEKKEKKVTAVGGTQTVKVTGTVSFNEVEKEIEDGEKEITMEVNSANVQFYHISDGSHIGYCNMTQDSFSMNVKPVSKNVECSIAFNEFLAGVQAEL